MEGVITALTDQFPAQLRAPFRKKLFVGAFCITNFFLGLPMVTRGLHSPVPPLASQPDLGFDWSRLGQEASTG